MVTNLWPVLKQQVPNTLTVLYAGYLYTERHNVGPGEIYYQMSNAS